MYRSAVIGGKIGAQGAWSDLAAGDSEIYRRPDETRETYILILSPNNSPLVLGTFALGSYLPGSKTKPIALSLDLDGPASRTFAWSCATTPASSEPQPGGASSNDTPAALGDQVCLRHSLSEIAL